MRASSLPANARQRPPRRSSMASLLRPGMTAALGLGAAGGRLSVVDPAWQTIRRHDQLQRVTKQSCSESGGGGLSRMVWQRNATGTGGRDRQRHSAEDNPLPAPMA